MAKTDCLKIPKGPFSYPLVFIFIYSYFEVASVFEAATKKTDCGTEPKTEGLISFATGFFPLIVYTTP